MLRNSDSNYITEWNINNKNKIKFIQYMQSCNQFWSTGNFFLKVEQCSFVHIFFCLKQYILSTVGPIKIFNKKNLKKYFLIYCFFKHYNYHFESFVIAYFSIFSIFRNCTKTSIGAGGGWGQNQFWWIYYICSEPKVNPVSCNS